MDRPAFKSRTDAIRKKPRPDAVGAFSFTQFKTRKGPASRQGLFCKKDAVTELAVNVLAAIVRSPFILEIVRIFSRTRFYS
jgi:hypothetical protein